METHFSFSSPCCWGRETKSLTDLTTQQHFQGHCPYSFSFDCMNLSCALTGQGSFSQSGSFYFFGSPICLTPDSPAAPLLLLAPNPTVSNMSFPLPASQVHPQVWGTQCPSVARHHCPLLFSYRTLLGALPKSSDPSHSEP